jgi:hypothetical protein
MAAMPPWLLAVLAAALGFAGALLGALGHANVVTMASYLKATGEDVRRFYSGVEW